MEAIKISQLILQYGVIQMNYEVLRLPQYEVRTRPTNQIKDLELVPGTLAFARLCLARLMLQDKLAVARVARS